MLYESPLESSRFGIKAGRIDVQDSSKIKEILGEAQKGEFKFLSCRIPSGNIHLIQDLEKEGFFTADVLLYYKRKVNPLNESEETLESCLAHDKDKESVIELATKAFHNYPSHYFVDRHFSKDVVNQIYPDWAKRCCDDRSTADEVLGYFYDGVLAGFVALKKNALQADIRLAAVHPDYQGRGILKYLLQGAEKWASLQQLGEVSYSTQLENIPPQKVLVRQGWELSHSFHTLHFWF